LITPLNLLDEKKMSPEQRANMRYLLLLMQPEVKGKVFPRPASLSYSFPPADHMDAWYAQAYNPAQIEGREK